MCATTGVRGFRGHRLYYTGGRILQMQSSYDSTVAAGILMETAFIYSFQSAHWEQSLGVCCVYTPTRCYPQFSARSNSLSRPVQHLFTRLCHLSLGRVVDVSQETVTRHRICQCWLIALFHLRPLLTLGYPLTTCMRLACPRWASGLLKIMVCM